MGKKSRDKGHAYEREISKDVNGIFQNACRNLDQTREKEGRDLDNTQPLCIQCKWHKRVAIGVVKKGLQEAIESVTNEYPFPCVTHRSDNEGSLITMRLGDFLSLWLHLTGGGPSASLGSSKPATDTPSDANEAHPFLEKWHEYGGW